MLEDGGDESNTQRIQRSLTEQSLRKFVYLFYIPLPFLKWREKTIHTDIFDFFTRLGKEKHKSIEHLTVKCKSSMKSTDIIYYDHNFCFLHNAWIQATEYIILTFFFLFLFFYISRVPICSPCFSWLWTARLFSSCSSSNMLHEASQRSFASLAS